MAVLAPPVQVVASGAPPFVHVPSGAPPFVAVAGLAPPIMLVASGAPPITLFNEDGSLWAGGGGATVGGAALLVDETDGFATDFTYATDASRVAVKVASVTTSYGLDSFYANAGTSPKQVWDVAGVLGWSPHNSCLQSETFDNASWNKGSTTITADAIAAPNGALTADKLVHSTTAVTSHNVVSTNISQLAGQSYTFQVWAKAGEWSWIGIEDRNAATRKTYFNLATGALGTINAAHTGASITAGSNGWYLCSITWISPDTTNQAVVIYLQSANLQGTVAGVVGEGVYLWGAQHNRGTVPTAYLPTTTAARYGLAVDYDPVTHAAKGLLCEPAATNLILNNASMSTQSVTVTAVAHTLSFTGAGTLTLSGVSTAGPLVGVDPSTRVSQTFTPTAGSLTLTVAGSVNRAQLETGTVATSPIPTFAATATRAGDQYSVTPASINYSATAGSWWAETYQNVFLAGVGRIIGYQSNVTPIVHQAIGSVALWDGTFLVKTATGNIPGRVIKIASAFQSGDRAIATEGLAAATDAGTTTTLLAPSSIGIGTGTSTQQMNGYIRKIYYLPRRMTNPQLVTATT